MDFNIIEEKMKKTISVFEENLAEVELDVLTQTF